MSDTMASLATYFCTVKARHVCRMARDVLGGNGILLDFHVMRHMCEMEALVTYEGTAEIQTLLVGRDITGQRLHLMRSASGVAAGPGSARSASRAANTSADDQGSCSGRLVT
jgi:Acyl-CoA dehydrogenase, C-terminal domain